MRVKKELLLSVFCHAFALFYAGNAFYESSTYSISASQAIQITMEMVPEAEIAEAMMPLPSPPPVVEKPKEEFVKPEKNIQIKKEPKLNKKTPEVTQNIAKNNLTTNSENTVQKTARASLGNYQTKAKPDYLKNPPPIYPSQSRRNKEEGTVLLKVKIDSNGKVNKAKIKKSSNYYRLDQAALESVRKWSFKPAKLAGISIESEAIVPIKFVLND